MAKFYAKWNDGGFVVDGITGNNVDVPGWGLFLLIMVKLSL